MRKIIGVLLTALVAVGSASCGGKKMSMPKLSMPKMFKQESQQAKIDKHIGRVLRSDTSEQFHKQLGELLEQSRKSGWDSGRLLTAVLDYAPKIEGEGQLLRHQQLLESLDAPKSAVIDAAALRLEKADAKEAQACRALLAWAAPADPRGPADFSRFAPYLSTHQNPPPLRLIQWMYDRDPAGAMRQMQAIYGARLTPDESRSLLVATRVLDQVEWKERSGLSKPSDPDPLAAEQLETLSRSEHWWVRLYAAKMLVRHPQLGKAELAERLQKDPNPLVQQIK